MSDDQDLALKNCVLSTEDTLSTATTCGSNLFMQELIQKLRAVKLSE